MRHLKVLFYLAFVLFIHVNDAYRILCVFPFNGKSHFQMFEALCKGLAKRGHQIDMISHFPSKKSIANYTDIIDLTGVGEQVVNSFTVEYGRSIQQSLTYHMATGFGGALCHAMGIEKMQKFIKNPPNDPPYDLVITEYFGSPCYLGFGHLLKTPVAIAVSFLSIPYVDDFMGNPLSYSFFPGFFNEKPVVDTFYDRLQNFLLNYPEILKFHYYTSDQTDMMKKYLGLPHIPNVRELEKNVSLALVNSHHNFYGIRPLVNTVVDVGGLHVEKDQPKLSPELKSWLDSADHGLVYFTFGSMLNIETLPKETLLSLYASFAKISPVKVLMKCANTTKLPPSLPSNVITSPWIPQVAVLGHKNTRVFITHGGLMGTQEAIYHGVPMIGIPVFADQMKNVNILVHKKIAVLVPLENITEGSMDEALNAILHDRKYSESAKRASRIFRDRPLSAMDTASFWIEYVIRNGPDSLKSPAAILPWWKLNLIDVFAFLIACLILVLYVLVAVSRFLLKNLYNNNARTEKKLK
ncbi:PREDICTED: UDP-glucuronosyltransferase 2C1-like [Habropoda laboriosa]|uniref:UDP-glucuronosyltransferase 2C1-like n=1 Tax=Habropoda laboriosa TaxID=597456 RepID=UPI00083DE9D5|nr:PREDICTED: UDP-glucuronosyltransferase 2C1-like [Habropoda laboriosa]